MKKAEFIGYLYALKDLAVDDTFDDFDDGVEWVLDKIIERAQQLDEPMQNSPTVPYTPPWSQTVPYPYGPWITYTTSWNDNKTELDNNSNSAYNIKYPEPNDWSVTYDKKNPTNFTVVK